MVLGDDSYSKGCGLESWCHILDGLFCIDLLKNCIVCLKRPKINKKETGVGPFFLKKTHFWRISRKSTIFICDRLNSSRLAS